MVEKTVYKFGILLIIASFAIATGDRAFSVEQSQASDAKTAYSVTGKVVISDGRPAANALIRFRDGMGDWDQAVADDEGEFQFSLNCRPHAIVYFYAADRSEVFWMEFRNNNISNRVKSPLVVQLVPAISIPVLVQQGGLPIKGASVVGRTKEFDWNFAPEETDDQGMAHIVIPSAHQLDQAWAIESRTGLGGRSDFENNPVDVVKLELMESRKRLALVLDDNDQPVANIRVKAELRCQDRSNVTGQLPELYSVTDQDGYATFAWFPSDRHWGFRAGVYENADYSWDYSKGAERNQFFLTGPYQDLRLVYVAATLQTIPASGRIIGAGGAVSGVRVVGYGMGPSGQSDLPSSVSDESGRFSLNLIPGLTYVVGITDDQWACDLVEVEVKEDAKLPDSLELQAYPATPLTIKVTQGRNKRPLSNVSVQHFQSKRIQIGPNHTGVPALSQGKILDENGVVVFGSPDGQIRINLGFQKWSAHQDIDVVKGEPMTIEFHAPAIGNRNVTGSIAAPSTEISLRLASHIAALESKQTKLDGNHELELEKAVQKKAFLRERLRQHDKNIAGNCAISIFSPFGDPRHAVTQTNRNGTWSVDLDANLICVHALSSDGKFSAFQTFRDVGDEVGQIELKPSAGVSGRLLSPAGTPLANREIYLTRVVPYNLVSIPVHYASVKTDDEGRFEFPSVTADLEQRISIRNGTGNIQYLTPATAYEPGKEIKDLEVTYQEKIARPLRLPNN